MIKNKELEKQKFVHKRDIVSLMTFIGLTLSSIISSLIIEDEMGKLIIFHLTAIFAFAMFIFYKLEKISYNKVLKLFEK